MQKAQLKHPKETVTLQCEITSDPSFIHSNYDFSLFADWCNFEKFIPVLYGPSFSIEIPGVPDTTREMIPLKTCQGPLCGQSSSRSSPSFQSVYKIKNIAQMRRKSSESTPLTKLCVCMCGYLSFSLLKLALNCWALLQRWVGNSGVMIFRPLPQCFHCPALGLGLILLIPLAQIVINPHKIPVPFVHGHCLTPIPLSPWIVWDASPR